MLPISCQMPVSPSTSTKLRYIHHKLPCGRVISIGFTAPAEKQGKVLLAFSFCSDKDSFSRAIARDRLHKRISFNHPKVIEAEQTIGQHINDVVVKAWNDSKSILTPVKWKEVYPDGVTIERNSKVDR